MKFAAILLTFVTLIGCGKENTMNSNNLPDGWKAGDVVPHDQIYSVPPEPSDPSLMNVYGMREGDRSHRLYLIPADTPVADVVRFFEVGSHAQDSYGDDAQETVALVADISTEIAKIIPCQPIFADGAGMKLRFTRQITQAELDKIEALFHKTKIMQAGLERYMSEWDGESAILAPVIKENMFHFWWD